MASKLCVTLEPSNFITAKVSSAEETEITRIRRYAKAGNNSDLTLPADIATTPIPQWMEFARFTDFKLYWDNNIQLGFGPRKIMLWSK